jgi:hypothetical protein
MGPKSCPCVPISLVFGPFSALLRPEHGSARGTHKNSKFGLDKFKATFNIIEVEG